MRPTVYATFLAVTASVLLAEKPDEIDAAIERYFDRYCDYTGGLGINHVSSHKYNYEFRQRLKKTEDRELKRLFVLRNLYPEVEEDFNDYAAGRIMIGKAQYRELTEAETISLEKKIRAKIDDLSSLDPDDDLLEIGEFKKRLGKLRSNVGNKKR